MKQKSCCALTRYALKHNPAGGTMFEHAAAPPANTEQRNKVAETFAYVTTFLSICMRHRNKGLITFVWANSVLGQHHFESTTPDAKLEEGLSRSRFCSVSASPIRWRIHQRNGLTKCLSGAKTCKICSPMHHYLKPSWNYCLKCSRCERRQTHTDQRSLNKPVSIHKC